VLVLFYSLLDLVVLAVSLVVSVLRMAPGCVTKFMSRFKEGALVATTVGVGLLMYLQGLISRIIC
jgi:hypothetical protein